MLESIISGIIQGIAEWLPISSEGLLVLVKTNIFGSKDALEAIIRQALFLHLGTFFAALIYFHRDVLSLVKKENKKTLRFLIIATLISGALGYLLLKSVSNLGSQLTITPRVITLFIGLLLLITAILQIKTPKKRGYKKPNDLKRSDGLLLGFLQGLAVLPGLSRSGLTISGLLLRKFDDFYALRLSFLMSLPIVLAGNILLNIKGFIFSIDLLLSFIASFIFGILTIHLLLKLAKKINFGYFVLIFGLLMIISACCS